MSIENLYRAESGRILATLIRLVGDFDLAEEVMHDAFAAALERWPGGGVPENPRAWLVSTARHKAIDRLRRDARFRRSATSSRTGPRSRRARRPSSRTGRRGGRTTTACG